jgi:zinc protease
MIMGLDPGAFVFYVGTVQEKVDRVVELMFAEVKTLKKSGIAESELQRTKNGLVGIRKIQLQTNAQLALQAGLDELYGLGCDNYIQYYDRINGTAAGDITRVAQTYFTDDDYVLVVLSPATEEGKKHK